MKLLSGLKTITTVQAGGIYKERWSCPSISDPFPLDATAETIFRDSSGAEILRIVGTFTTPVMGFGDDPIAYQHLTFLEQPETMAVVPNGASFEVIVTDADGPNYFKYGTVFRRQNFFPHSPADLSSYEPKKYTDTFQRPPGPLGGRWVNVMGRPKIFDNTGVLPNSVGPDWNFLQRYYARFYVPFNSDSVDLSISCIDKGPGRTFVSLCSNADGTSHLYAMFDSSNDSLTLGISHTNDVGLIGFGLSADWEPQAGPVALVVPSASVANYKLRFDAATKEFSFFNSDYTVEHLSWTDTDDLVPHGKGYRYFAFGGNSGLFDSGVQIAYISAADMV